MDFPFDLPPPAAPLTVALCFGIAFARGMDFLSTWLITPKLALEANPLMRRTGWWRMALLNLPLLGLPWLHHGLSVTFIVTSLLAAGSNLCHGALARGAGERSHLEAQRKALQRLGLPAALALNTLGGLLLALGGAVILLLVPETESLPWWGALGVVMVGVVNLVHYNAALVRLSRRRTRR